MQLAPLCLSEVHTGSGGGLGLDRVRCMGLSRVGGPEARLWLFGLRRACVVLSSSSSQGIPRKQSSAACILSNRKCKSQGTAIMINSRPIVTLIMDSNDECDRGGLYNYFLESGKAYHGDAIDDGVLKLLYLCLPLKCSIIIRRVTM